MTDGIAPSAQLQLFPPGTDLFTALGLPRRLNPDLAAMEAVFHDLSRRFHPDRYATAEPRLRRISLENSALVNRAYRTLRDPWSRAAYLVELEQGRGTSVEAKAPAALFEEILELQEVLAGLRMAIAKGEPADDIREHAERTAAPFRQAFASLDARLQALNDAWDAAADAPGHEEILSKIKELLGERRYLQRVVADIDAGMEGKPAPRDI